MDEYAYSTNEENFHGSFATEREAIIEGFANNNRAVIMVGKCQPATPAEGFIDADLLIEHVACQDEYCGEWSEDWPGATKEQLAELTDDLQKAFGTWMDRHGLRPTFYTVPDAKEIQRPDDMPGEEDED